MKKLIYIYLLSALFLLFTHETNAHTPFDGKTWEADSEEDNLQSQERNNQNNDHHDLDPVDNNDHAE